MKSKVLLFLFCCISNLYCMDPLKEKKPPKKFQQRGRPRKKITKKEIYSVKCSEPKCSKEFKGKQKSLLIRPLLRHIYSHKHNPKLYGKFYDHVNKNARKVGNMWFIETSDQQSLKASNISALVGFLMFHDLATQKKNPDGFEKMKKYVRENAKKLDS